MVISSSVRSSIHLLKPKPCIGSHQSALRSNRSSVPCSRSFASRGIASPTRLGENVQGTAVSVKDFGPCASVLVRYIKTLVFVPPSAFLFRTPHRVEIPHPASPCVTSPPPPAPLRNHRRHEPGHTRPHHRPRRTRCRAPQPRPPPRPSHRTRRPPRLRQNHARPPDRRTHRS